jgi:hypothetical protein
MARDESAKILRGLWRYHLIRHDWEDHGITGTEWFVVDMDEGVVVFESPTRNAANEWINENTPEEVS